jgi:hypothetical protein
MSASGRMPAANKKLFRSLLWFAAGDIARFISNEVVLGVCSSWNRGVTYARVRCLSRALRSGRSSSRSLSLSYYSFPIVSVGRVRGQQDDESVLEC